MRTRTTVISAAFVGIFGLMASLSAVAADTAVSRVIVVQTADVPGYVHEVETLQALLKKAGVPATLRVWRATYAGADTGSIVAIVEVPNLAGIAKVEDAIRTNPDLAAEMKKISAMRKIVSDSLYDLLSH
jgi:hypothetical protein